VSTQSTTVVDLSAYRERRRAASTVAAAPGPAPYAGFVGMMMIPIPVMVMWTPVWFTPSRVSPGHE
jgi:hypothetical protein